ncbi:hypothetical protein ThimaDRAFT_3003 [Thiocapsa marina 5811]|uniref:Uncharacterized protein n=1 Tax=Thiocapsa marina 5811 TaxID=768671 RepID=F9UDK0_9GAMM|nr:hypothetical protein ThimaDRAFT_3003 [Thiocapsa marina 5811]
MRGRLDRVRFSRLRGRDAERRGDTPTRSVGASYGTGATAPAVSSILGPECEACQ